MGREPVVKGEHLGFAPRKVPGDIEVVGLVGVPSRGICKARHPECDGDQDDKEGRNGETGRREGRLSNSRTGSGRSWTGGGGPVCT